MTARAESEARPRRSQWTTDWENGSPRERDDVAPHPGIDPQQFAGSAALVNADAPSEVCEHPARDQRLETGVVGSPRADLACAWHAGVISTDRKDRSAMRVVRIVPNVASEAFLRSRDFYAGMFDLEVSVELDDWYLQLKSADDPRLNIGFLKPGSELFAGRDPSLAPSGVVLTIHVDDVDEAHDRAMRLGADVAADIRTEEYGQRHFVVVDPNGLLLNVMSNV